MKKSEESAKGNDSSDLELPDWSGMDESTDRVSVSTAFELCEQYARWVPRSHREEEAREKCLVEFVL